MTTAAATRPATVRVTIPFAAAWIAAEAKAAALPASRVRHYRAFSVVAGDGGLYEVRPEAGGYSCECVANSRGIPCYHIALAQPLCADQCGERAAVGLDTCRECADRAVRYAAPCPCSCGGQAAPVAAPASRSHRFVGSFCADGGASKQEGLLVCPGAAVVVAPSTDAEIAESAAIAAEIVRELVAATPTSVAPIAIDRSRMRMLRSPEQLAAIASADEARTAARLARLLAPAPIRRESGVDPLLACFE